MAKRLHLANKELTRSKNTGTIRFTLKNNDVAMGELERPVSNKSNARYFIHSFR